MQVTTKITVDLTRQNVGQRVNAVQGDGNTRLVEITLLSGGAPWTPPEGVEAAIAYMQPGGTKGLYNKLADGTPAIAISGNVATVILATQMLTASGTVQASLVFNDAALNRLTTFPFSVSVASNPAAGAQKVEDYLRLQWLEDKLEEYLAAIKASGAFNGKPGDNGVTFTPSVSENGDLSWRNNGGLPNPQTVNIRGPQGDSTAATAAAHAAQTSAANAETHAADAAASAAEAQEAVGAMGTELSQIEADLSAEQTARENAVNAMRADLTANADADAVTKRSLDALWKLNQGISYQFEQDDTESYQKTVPSGAKLASVGAVGGKTVVWNHLVASDNTSATPVSGRKILSIIDGVWELSVADGSEISVTGGTDMVVDLTLLFGSGNEPKSTDDPRIAWIEQFAIEHPEYNAGELVSAVVEIVKYNYAVIADIPTAVRNLTGYGWSARDVCNSIERTDTGWQYVQRVGGVDLGTLTWMKYGNFLAFYSSESLNVIGSSRNLMCSRYNYMDASANSVIDATTSGVGIRNISGRIRVLVKDENITEDTVAITEALNGVMLYYELAEPVITDITDLMNGTLDAIPVEPGGTLTFENTAKLLVPSSVEYLISLAEVNG